MSRAAVLPNRELLDDALRAPRPSSGGRIWYRDQHMRGADRAVDVRECFRAALIQARRMGDSSQELLSTRW